MPTTPTLTTPLDLLGRWSLEREIEDRYAAARLRVTGTAVLEQVDGGRVRWHEEGLLERPGSAPAAVHRTLLVVPDAAGSWQVTFDDGRPFHPWSPGLAVDHPCADDLYRGVVDIQDRGRWTVTWQVRGPAKDHTITTAYARPVA
ncbi:DUF6314 family protein [Nocardioides sp. AX2bis]|uniref:DUF6314 family protein n=1 Tax=Nocardioides sp. AX2bis TaxID=2653157 RepID=UPI0012F04F2C|nr:DUF6314 family protein [Nocardioides sp. AX2bis]VXC51112.1 conserved hypothetical protein [Nocardioides sp. AX2bis]